VRRYFPSVLKGRNMSETPRSISFASLENSIPQASLESILCTEELQRRPSRPRDYERDNQALVKLVSALADSPSTILQVLAETILDIAQCDSAGLSLLTRDGKTPDLRGHRFYWPAIAGMWLVRHGPISRSGEVRARIGRRFWVQARRAPSRPRPRSFSETAER
jgi:hypothetical protein